MGRKVHDLKNKMLSWAGREILVKACLQSIPLYSMSVFKAPKGICSSLTALGVHFWWSGDDKRKAIHWIRKEILLKEKAQGGLAFRCFESLNMAMLMKQIWRLLTNPDGLASKVLQGRYFRNGDILGCSKNPRASYAWKSIISAMEIFKHGVGQNSDMQRRWKYSASGVYTVKSGYVAARMWVLAKQGDNGETSNRAAVKNIHGTSSGNQEFQTE